MPLGPGVKQSNLHEDRDLMATTDLRAVLKGLLGITCALMNVHRRLIHFPSART